MTDKEKSTNTAFSQQQRTQIGNACEQVQNAININNSTLAVPNEDLVHKADEIAIKWKAYGLPYNAIRDAAIEMACWQKEQMMKSAVSIGYLQDWYQNSIDEEVPPIWTDKHLNELTNDFYLIPKQNEDNQCSTE